MTLKLQLKFIADKCEPIVHLTDFFQSRKPVTTQVFDVLEDLQINFVGHRVDSIDTCWEYFEEADDLNLASKKSILDVVKEAFDGAEQKLDKYLTEGQPGIKFLQQCRLFNPSRLSILAGQKDEFNSIPGFVDQVSDAEFKLYFEHLGPEAVKAASPGRVDMDLFWDGMADRLPIMSKFAKDYMNAVTNSAEVERSNSIYKLVLSARRRSLSERSIQALVFLYYNQRVNNGLLDAEYEDDLDEMLSRYYGEEVNNDMVTL